MFHNARDRINSLVLTVALALVLLNRQFADAQQSQRVVQSDKADASQGPIKDKVRGGVAFSPQKRIWTRITGKVKVIDAHRVEFEDGTEVDSHWSMTTPDFEQQGSIAGALYPAGKEAAEFLRKLIDDQPVTFIGHPDGEKMRGPCFVGETSLAIEMVRNGWAFSDHEAMDPVEIFARENKRGMWQGEFIPPQRWQKGERLPGEPAAAATSN